MWGETSRVWLVTRGGAIFAFDTVNDRWLQNAMEGGCHLEVFQSFLQESTFNLRVSTLMALKNPIEHDLIIIIHNDYLFTSH